MLSLFECLNTFIDCAAISWVVITARVQEQEQEQGFAYVYLK